MCRFLRPAPACKLAPCRVGAVGGEDESREPAPASTTIPISLKPLSPFAARTDNSCIPARAQVGDMAQGNSYGQTSNGVADESPNMLVYRKVRISSLSWTKGELLAPLKGFLRCQLSGLMGFQITKRNALEGDLMFSSV